MPGQFDNGFNDCSRQLAALANRAGRLLLENAESAIGVQLRMFERNATATAGFIGELSRAGAHLPALLPQGLQVASDNLQRLGHAGHEVLGLGLKAGAAIGELVRQPLAPAPAQPRKAR